MEDRIKSILPFLNEKQKRLFVGAEAKALGFGGVKKIHEITGMSMTTIIKGRNEIETANPDDGRIRIAGGGRKPIEETQKGVVDAIDSIVSSNTYGNPENTLKWTTKSLSTIEEELKKKNFNIGQTSISKILKKENYSLQLNQKMLQVGDEHPDRNKQFEFINNKSTEMISKGVPVISIDAKKKENLGNFKNNGKEYRKKGDPRKVLDHDFPIEELGKVIPYGVYDINENEGFVNLGISKDTAEFAVESISRWWLTVGKNTYPNTKEIYINSDGGGSNGSKNRLYKHQIQEFANQSGLIVHISHFPPGTSKWNKIEHRLFCYISKNWKGQPLIDIETVINLIGSTTTKKGLKVICIRDENEYKIGKKISDEDFDKINLKDQLCISQVKID